MRGQHGQRCGTGRRLAATAALFSALGCSAAQPAGPHVVLITVDTLRADRLGLYGYVRDTSPNIDRYFADGTVFETASSSAPCTIPSVSQYLAGAFDYDTDRKVLAELLQERGYRTGAVVSQHTFRQGLDLYQRGFEHFDIQAENEVNWNDFTTRTADEVTDRALTWLGENADAERLFLWVHYFDPHAPYAPPAAHRGFAAGDASAKHADMARHRKDSGSDEAGVFEPQDIVHFRNLYDGEIRFTDAEIGRLLAGLEAAGIADDAVVALTADHGEWLWENGRRGHCMGLSKTELHVPLLVRVNGRPLGGRARVGEPTSTLDLVPTLAGLLGIELPADAYHGVDLRAPQPERVVAAMWSAEVSVGDAEWKLVLVQGKPRALYWTSGDPEERWNRLMDRAEQRNFLLDRSAPYVALHRRMHLDQIEEMLRKIGYIQ